MEFLIQILSSNEHSIMYISGTAYTGEIEKEPQPDNSLLVRRLHWEVKDYNPALNLRACRLEAGFPTLKANVLNTKGAYTLTGRLFQSAIITVHQSKLN